MRDAYNQPQQNSNQRYSNAASSNNQPKKEYTLEQNVTSLVFAVRDIKDCLKEIADLIKLNYSSIT